ncbi:MAG: hypothetical protein ACYSO7_06915 [Planctomycetota bacterium]|jgi:hypothetical protein
MLCLRPNLENAVFEDFDPAVHVRPVGYDAGLPLYRAMDFGFANPFVCLWMQVDEAGAVRVRWLSSGRRAMSGSWRAPLSIRQGGGETG